MKLGPGNLAMSLFSASLLFTGLLWSEPFSMRRASFLIHLVPVLLNADEVYLGSAPDSGFVVIYLGSKCWLKLQENQQAKHYPMDRETE